MFEESLILLKESISIQLVDSPKVIRMMPFLFKCGALGMGTEVPAPP